MVGYTTRLKMGSLAGNVGNIEVQGWMVDPVIEITAAWKSRDDMRNTGERLS